MEAGNRSGRAKINAMSGVVLARFWTMNAWRGKRPQTNFLKSSQRAFAIFRFWWHLAPNGMVRRFEMLDVEQP